MVFPKKLLILLLLTSISSQGVNLACMDTSEESTASYNPFPQAFEFSPEAPQKRKTDEATETQDPRAKQPKKKVLFLDLSNHHLSSRKDNYAQALTLLNKHKDTIAGLNFSSNDLLNLSPQQWQELANCISPNITHLDLSNNSLNLICTFNNRYCFAAFRNFLEKFPNLAELDLKNNFGEDFSPTIEQEVGGVMATFYHNSLSNIIRIAIRKMPNLKNINFGLNGSSIQENFQKVLQYEISIRKSNPNCNTTITIS